MICSGMSLSRAVLMSRTPKLAIRGNGEAGEVVRVFVVIGGLRKAADQIHLPVAGVGVEARVDLPGVGVFVEDADALAGVPWVVVV